MGNRKKGSDTSGIVFGVLVLAFLLLILVIVITPAVLLTGWIYYSIKLKKFYTHIQGNVSDFWLTPDEKSDFKSYAYGYAKADKEIKRAWRKGEEADISLNMDGTFSSRSRLGKELKEIIEENEPILNECLERKESISNLPFKRWLQFHKAYIRKKAFRLSFIIWVISINVLACISSDTYTNALVRVFEFPFLLLDSKATSDDWQRMLGITAICIVFFFINLAIEKKNSKKITPIPPEVTLDNLDIDIDVVDEIHTEQRASPTRRNKRKKQAPQNEIPQKFITSFLRIREGKPKKNDDNVLLNFLEEGHDILAWIKVILKEGGAKNINAEMKAWKESIESVTYEPEKKI